MNIQWFPGHMTKTRRMIEENIRLIDLVIEIADARLPLSSRNPLLDKITASKPKILVLNKADIADPEINKAWVEYYRKQGVKALLTDSKNGKIFNQINAAIREELSELIAKREQKGMAGKPLRVMVAGVPNVGKSTFINKLSGHAGAKTGDRPGVTTGKQWISVRGAFDLLDTPGMLWEKFENENQALNLAYSGAIKDTVVDIEELSVYLLGFLKTNYKEQLCARYKLGDIDEEMDNYELLTLISKKRGFVVSGGEADTERGANILLDEFRGAKIGLISLEKPE
ncbi:MAG: ribosome biogenesis GTPase YlqF [Clostridia bacterium]|nr:ribosome biogenesis GTPase YlqF [Clostridia bacterium]